MNATLAATVEHAAAQTAEAACSTAGAPAGPVLSLDVEAMAAKPSQKTPLSAEGGRSKLSQGLFRNGGTIPTAICLTKAAVGAGVLTIAAHCAEVGFAYTLTCLIVGGILTVIGVVMIADASVATGRWSFEDICDDLFHPAMAIWTGFINTCNCLGAASGYLIVCGQIFAVVTNANENARRAFVILVGIFVCCPLALARHVSFMRHLAALSVASICLLVIAVVVYLGDHGVDDSVTEETFWAGPGEATVFTYMNTVNIVIFAYNNQFNVPQLTSELTPQPNTKQMTVVSMISTTICFSLYVAVSLFGVFAFGVDDQQKDTLVLDLYPARNTPLVFAALCAVGFSVLTCFQFHIYPIRQFLAYVTRQIRGQGANDEASDKMYCGRSLTRWLDIVCALVSVAVAIVIAVVFTDLKNILDFVGAFAGAWVSYVIPPMFSIQIRRQRKDFTWFSLEILSYVLFCALGGFLFMFGTYAAIRG
jgi:amino acid permease